MSWRAPDLSHLLDQRLQAARLELMDDNRILRALHGRGQDPTHFLRRLIEEKLAAAARSGLGAVEASLRSSASDYLAAAGFDAAAIRQKLDELGGAILALDGRRPHELQKDTLRPGTTATLFFGAWLFFTVTGWAVGDANTVLFAFLATGGLLASVLVYLFAHVASLRRRETVAKEYPVVLCRTYLDGLAEGVAAYEATVNTLAGGE